MSNDKPKNEEGKAEAEAAKQIAVEQKNAVLPSDDGPGVFVPDDHNLDHPAIDAAEQNPEYADYVQSIHDEAEGVKGKPQRIAPEPTE